MVCNFSWLDGPNHPPFFMFSQSERHIKDRNGWIVQFSCLQSFTISFRIIRWQFRNTHCRLAFPELRAQRVPAGAHCTTEALKQDFSLPGLSSRAWQSRVEERGLPEQLQAPSVPAPTPSSHPRLVTSRGAPCPQAGVQRGAQPGDLGQGDAGSRVLLQPSVPAGVCESGQEQSRAPEPRRGTRLLLGTGHRRGGTGSTQQSCHKWLLRTLPCSLS